MYKWFPINYCEWNIFPQKYAEHLTLGISECDLVWK